MAESDAPVFTQHVETVDVSLASAPFDAWLRVLQMMRDNAAGAGLVLHGEPIDRRRQLVEDPRFPIGLERYSATWLAEGAQRTQATAAAPELYVTEMPMTIEAFRDPKAPPEQVAVAAMRDSAGLAGVVLDSGPWKVARRFVKVSEDMSGDRSYVDVPEGEADFVLFRARWMAHRG